MDSPPVKLLLVEDNPGDTRFLREILKDARGIEFDFHHASRLDAALEILGKSSFDIVLLDLALPDGGGIDTVTRTRQAVPQVPIIILTGLNDEAFALRSVREGAQDYLIKSEIETNVVVRSIRYAIERHRLQLEHEKQQRQIERLAAFVQFNPNPVLEFSPEGDLLYFNEAAADMAQSLSLADPGKMMLPETPDIVREALSSGQAREGVETEIAGRTVSWAFFPIPNLAAVHSYVMDITERVQLEATLRHSQKMEAVGQLAAGVAHDFNNFLSIIQGHLDLIQASEPPERFSHSLAQATSATDSASHLTRQLLTLGHSQEMRQVSLDLNEIVGRIANLISRPLGDVIQLKIETARDLPKVQADPGMIQQMILNLAVNARDAMPEGGTLTMATKNGCTLPERTNLPEQMPSGAHVCMTVTDTGCGMDAETISRIFEPFFSTKAVGKGTGLGLATVYGIVKQHKGWIDVTSRVGEGATFTVYLPAEE